MTIHAINHVQLAFPAGQEAAIRHFYTDLLGLTELGFTTGPALRFNAGGQRLDLLPASAWQPPSALPHLAFEVTDLPRLRARLLGASLALDESRPLPGHLRFYAQDPAGNQLEFLQPEPSGAAA
ncbi:MAG: glyoxalase [Polaromonas sp.]|nr:glyoxalase [Polaromonas sp.]